MDTTYQITDVSGEEVEVTEEEIIKILTEEYTKEIKETIRTEVSLALREGIRDVHIIEEWIEDNF